MLLNSVVKNVGSIPPPVFKGDQLYMQAVDAATRKLPTEFSRWSETVSAMLDRVPMTEGVVYLTIDEKELTPGKSQRRGGAHVDGIWIPEKKAHGTRPGHIMHVGGWDSKGDWVRASHGGGLMLLSNVEGCKAWAGAFEGEPGEGGDLEHIRSQLNAASSITLSANNAYLLNVWGVHESIPVTEPVQRSLVRLTLPETIVIH
jgi:hypothetical protein